MKTRVAGNNYVSAANALAAANLALKVVDTSARQKMINQALNPSYYPINPNSDPDILHKSYMHYDQEIANDVALRNYHHEHGKPLYPHTVSPHSNDDDNTGAGGGGGVGGRAGRHDHDSSEDSDDSGGDGNAYTPIPIPVFEPIMDRVVTQRHRRSRSVDHTSTDRQIRRGRSSASLGVHSTTHMSIPVHGLDILNSPVNQAEQLVLGNAVGVGSMPHESHTDGFLSGRRHFMPGSGQASDMGARGGGLPHTSAAHTNIELGAPPPFSNQMALQLTRSDPSGPRDQQASMAHVAHLVTPMSSAYSPMHIDRQTEVDDSQVFAGVSYEINGQPVVYERAFVDGAVLIRPVGSPLYSPTMQPNIENARIEPSSTQTSSLGQLMQSLRVQTALTELSTAKSAKINQSHLMSRMNHNQRTPIPFPDIGTRTPRPPARKSNIYDTATPRVEVPQNVVRATQPRRSNVYENIPVANHLTDHIYPLLPDITPAMANILEPANHPSPPTPRGPRLFDDAFAGASGSGLPSRSYEPLRMAAFSPSTPHASPGDLLKYIEALPVARNVKRKNPRAFSRLNPRVLASGPGGPSLQSVSFKLAGTKRHLGTPSKYDSDRELAFDLRRQLVDLESIVNKGETDLNTRTLKRMKSRIKGLKTRIQKYSIPASTRKTPAPASTRKTQVPATTRKKTTSSPAPSSSTPSSIRFVMPEMRRGKARQKNMEKRQQVANVV